MREIHSLLKTHKKLQVQQIMLCLQLSMYSYVTCEMYFISVIWCVQSRLYLPIYSLSRVLIPLITKRGLKFYLGLVKNYHFFGS
jgi:hypothetical protein